MDGELGCGTASEPGIPSKQRVAPWWIPISFKTATDIDAHWAPMDTCASLAPIYTLKVRHAGTTVVCVRALSPSSASIIAGLVLCFLQSHMPNVPPGHPSDCWTHLATITMAWSPLRKALLLQGDDDWVKLNVEQYGFYRVQYPDELWQRLTEVAAHVVDDIPLLPEVEFAGLLADAWALNDAGIVPVHTFLNLTRCDFAPFPHFMFCRASWPSVQAATQLWAILQVKLAQNLQLLPQGSGC